MKKIFYLKSCKTCQRILHELKPGPEIELIDIKNNPIDEEELKKIKEKVGSYKVLFSRNAILYRKLNLHYINLTEEDYKNYILMHYTFLKRPLIVHENKFSIGSNREAINKAKEIFGVN